MNMFKQTIRPVFTAGFLMLAVAGCTTRYGGIVPNSAFAYPNSNVTAMGPVKASVSKTMFFIPPSFQMKDIQATYDAALKQVPGANVIINYKEDSALTTFMMFNTITYSIDGTAAKMDVGMKDIAK